MEFTNKDFQTTMEAVMSIPPEIKKLSAARAELPKSYVGEMLQIEQIRIDEQIKKLETTRKETLDGLRAKLVAPLDERRQAAIEQGERDDMNGAKLTDDYKFFSLPVTLTSEEVQRLYDRHWNSPLFTRTLKAYVEKNRNKTPLNVEYMDPFNKAANDIYKVLNSVGYHSSTPAADQFLANNPALIEQWDQQITDALESVAEDEL